MMTKRPLMLAGISVTAAYLLWRVREQGRLVTAFLENGVDEEAADQAADALIPFFSLATYNDVVGAFAPSSRSEWQEYAAAASGSALVLLD